MTRLGLIIVFLGAPQDGSEASPARSAPPPVSQAESALVAQNEVLAERLLDSIRTSAAMGRRSVGERVLEQIPAGLALVLSVLGLWWQKRDRREDKYHSEVATPVCNALLQLRIALGSRVDAIRNSSDGAGDEIERALQARACCRDAQADFLDCRDHCSGAFQAWGAEDRAKALLQDLERLEDGFTTRVDEITSGAAASDYPALRRWLTEEIAALQNQVGSNPCNRRSPRG